MIMNKTLTATDVTAAWDAWYTLLYADYKETKKTEKSRDGAVASEVIGAVTHILDPTRNIVQSKIRKMPIRYAMGEFLWYLSGNNSLKEIQKYAPKSWNRMSDDGLTVNSNYGHKIFRFYGFDQWEYVKELLVKDPNTRQAIIHIKEPRDTIENPTKDLPCTISLQFLQREGKLNLITYMRSNDIWMGFPYDVFNFCNFLVLMSMEIELEVGTYTHIAGSLHLYERDIPDLKGENE